MSFNVISCGYCNSSVGFFDDKAYCECGKTRYVKNEGNYCHKDFEGDDEMSVRDIQAKGYLLHDKFPTQISSVKSWLPDNAVAVDKKTKYSTPNRNRKLALDLGCGPGPYTKLLKDQGYNVIAVDYSAQSLKINSLKCVESQQGNEVVFVQEDLNDLFLMENSVDLVLMADFLQHMGSRKNRERLLQEAFSALKIGGQFYLSFFNINIKNYLKGDIHGNFSGGKISYERLTPMNVVTCFPDTVSVKKSRSMNITHGAFMDNMLTALLYASTQGFFRECT